MKMREEIHERCVEMYGESSLHTIDALGSLASSYLDTGQSRKALPIYRKVFEEYKRIYGEEHPNTLGAMTNLAGALSDVGEISDAIDLQQRSLAIKRRVLPHSHPFLVVAMLNLSRFFLEAELVEDALDISEELLDLCRREHGEEHPDTLTAMAYLAAVFTKLGRSEDARELQEQVLAKRRGTLAPSHPESLNAFFNAIDSRAEAGEWDKAIELAEDLQQRALEKYGAEHPDALKAVWPLAFTYKRMGNLEKAAMVLCLHSERLRRAGMADDSELQRQISDGLAGLARDGAVKPPSENSVVRYYEDKQELFRRASVNLKMIMQRRKPPGPGRQQQQRQMEALMEELEGGRHFSGAAQEHSEDSWADDGGNRGRIERGTFGWKLEEAIFSAPPGKPTLYANGTTVWILLVEDPLTADGFLPFEEVSSEIEDRLYAEMLAGKIEDWRQQARDILKKTQSTPGSIE